MLFVLLGCLLFCLPLFFVSAWWNRGIADEVTIASFCKAVTGTAVMARSANEEKKKNLLEQPFIEAVKLSGSCQSVTDDLFFFLHAFVHPQLPSGLIRNLFRLACLSIRLYCS